jgi:ParB family chromosome partitioning protein
MAKKKVFAISHALTEGIEETIQAARGYSGELRIEIIPLKRLEVDPDNPRDLALTYEDIYQGIVKTDPHFSRKTQEMESLQGLANSIREQGIINPVVVYKFGEKYRLVAGERRTLASILAGKIDIQAKILDRKPTELDISLLQWIENVERTDLSLWERLKNLEKIVAAYAATNHLNRTEISATVLSQLIGCTKPHAANYKAVLNSDDELKQLILKNQIRSLEKAAVIATIQSAEIKKQALTECLAGASLKRLKNIATQKIIKTSHIKKSVESRGRQTTSVNLGITKNTEVARIILESVLKNSRLASIAVHFKQVDWSDYRAINSTFKQLIKKLEDMHYKVTT